MLYPKNEQKNLSSALFNNPTSEYRGAPFWAWNCKLNKDLLMKQIDQLQEMGMGGFHVHCRTGMETQYLSEEFMELVKACKDTAKQKEMLCWLYDEDRWPSGFAGGLVTKDINFRARYLVLSPKQFDDTYLPNCSAFQDAIANNSKPKGYLISKGTNCKATGRRHWESPSEFII